MYAPLAHRLGIHALKWELEDLAFQTLHPRKYAEIKAMVADRRADREAQAEKAAEILGDELDKADIPAEITGRAKHLYSIYDKMAKRGREFNEIYDLTAMRVICERSGEEGTRDCYAALGLVHSLWKPMPGRFKDFVAMPKLNRYRSLHTTVIGPEGRAARDPGAHARDARGGRVRRRRALALQARPRGEGRRRVAHLGQVAHGLDRARIRTRASTCGACARTSSPTRSTSSRRRARSRCCRRARRRSTSPTRCTRTSGHRTVGAKVNGRIVPLHYRLRSGDFVEILTSKSGRGPSRDWLALVTSSRARNKIRQWYQRETRGETEAKGREALDQALKAQKLPYRKLQGSSVLAQVIRETGFKKAEDFYVALGAGKLSPTQIVNKVIQRLKTDEVADEPLVRRSRRARERRSRATASGST